MKVMYVINGLGTGGAERSLSEMLTRLPDHGVETSVVCLHRRREGVEGQVARDHGVTFVDARGWRPRIAAVRALVRHDRPDVVHTSIFEADVIGRLAARGEAKVVSSIVSTSYEPIRLADPNVRRWRLEAARQLDGWTARRYTDRFHALSEAVRESAARSLGIDRDVIDVIPRGRDRARLGESTPERREAARERLGVALDAPVVLHVGRQEFAKAIDTLMRAAARVLGDVVFIQAGREGNASPALRQLHAELRLGDRFRFLGHREDVGDLFAAADLFAFPSRYEGLGGAAIEAMAMGLPIVSTDIPALREVVEEGGNAVMTPVDDAAAFAAAIRSLLGDAGRRASFSRRGRELFHERFDVDTSVARMAQLYRRTARASERVHA